MNTMVILFILSFLTICSAQVTMSSEYLTSRNIAINVHEKGAYAEVQADNDALTTEYVKERAEKIFTNIANKEIKSSAIMLKNKDNEIVAKNGVYELYVSKATGSEFFVDIERFAQDEETNLVGEKDAIKNASKYLKQTFKNTVDSGQVKFIKVRKLHDAHAEIDESGNQVGQVTERIVNYSVWFGRYIDGIEVVGPGDKIGVFIARNGDVIGHSKNWKSQIVKKNCSKKAVHPKVIEEHLSQKIKDNKAEQVNMRSIKLGYYSMGKNVNQKEMPVVYQVSYDYGPHSKVCVDYFDAFNGEILKDNSIIENGSDYK